MREPVSRSPKQIIVRSWQSDVSSNQTVHDRPYLLGGVVFFCPFGGEKKELRVIALNFRTIAGGFFVPLHGLLVQYAQNFKNLRRGKQEYTEMRTYTYPQVEGREMQ